MKHIFSIKTWLVFATYLIAILLIFGCIAFYIPVGVLPIIAFFSLVLPFLVIGNFIVLVYWLVKWNRAGLVSLISLFISYIVFGSFYRFEDNSVYMGSDGLTLMTFNTGNFNDRAAIRDEEGNRLKSFLLEKDPDVLCLQESSRIRHKDLKHYPYNYVTPYDAHKSMQGIYSKYPIIDKGSLDFPETANNAIYADIVVGKDTLRIYNLHLQSFKIIPGRIKKSKNPFRFYGRMEATFLKQEEQAVIFNEHFTAAPYRKMVCADLNNTPFSNVYRLVKNDLVDTFDEKGLGVGMTYDINILPFRIDFLLIDKSMEVKKHQNFEVMLSDHEPVMATIKL